MIRAEGLRKCFGEVVAVDNLSLEIHEGEFFSLLGPSGCGKTTLLRLLAGLEEPDSGRLWIGEKEMTSVPPQRRPVNTVFQNYALFPHLTVRENISFGLRMRETGSGEIVKRVDKILETVQISNLAGRMPEQLSGGQKQRVALARAVVNEPKVLLLDEPLSALDARLRRELRSELRALQRGLGMTFVFVTHDQEEALALSDRVALMNHGKIEQLGSPRTVYEHPKTEFAARFLGGCNIIEGKSAGENEVATEVGRLILPKPVPAGSVKLAVRPERIEIVESPAEVNCFPAEVVLTTYSGAQTECVARVNGRLLQYSGAKDLRAGNSVWVVLPREAITVLES